MPRERYSSKSKALRVRCAQQREKRLAASDVAIARGVADAEAGRGESVSTVFTRLEMKLRRRF
jgi:antitoxin ParD1/3/4